MNGKHETTQHSRPLWAPWRIDFIRTPRADGCFLCVKAQSPEDAANHVIGRGEHAYVLMNDFPYNSGHLLVVPYRHVSTLNELNGGEQAEMMSLIIKAQETLTRVMAPQGFNIGFNIGSAAGAGVADHVHGHVVPRWVGDTNFMPVLGDRRVVPESLDQTADLLRGAWHD